ncbi:unnamed protein product [Caenorhabditis sp. 36 PRJEB53466]|nr:unnamed protein product [Caenorhabditis sp. 36 PRJEB53466]
MRELFGISNEELVESLERNRGDQEEKEESDESIDPFGTDDPAGSTPVPKRFPVFPGPDPAYDRVDPREESEELARLAAEMEKRHERKKPPGPDFLVLEDPRSLGTFMAQGVHFCRAVVDVLMKENGLTTEQVARMSANERNHVDLYLIGRFHEVPPVSQKRMGIWALNCHKNPMLLHQFLGVLAPNRKRTATDRPQWKTPKRSKTE